jgi:hypothetical protein
VLQLRQSRATPGTTFPPPLPPHPTPTSTTRSTTRIPHTPRSTAHRIITPPSTKNTVTTAKHLCIERVADCPGETGKRNTQSIPRRVARLVRYLTKRHVDVILLDQRIQQCWECSSIPIVRANDRDRLRTFCISLVNLPATLGLLSANDFLQLYMILFSHRRVARFSRYLAILAARSARV